MREQVTPRFEIGVAKNMPLLITWSMLRTVSLNDSKTVKRAMEFQSVVIQFDDIYITNCVTNIYTTVLNPKCVW